MLSVLIACKLDLVVHQINEVRNLVLVLGSLESEEVG